MTSTPPGGGAYCARYSRRRHLMPARSAWGMKLYVASVLYNFYHVSSCAGTGGHDACQGLDEGGVLADRVEKRQRGVGILRA